MNHAALHAAFDRLTKNLGPLKEPFEKLSSPALANLIHASVKNAPFFYGRCWSKLDSSLAFAETALTSPIYLIGDLALTIISAPFALCSKDASEFFKCHLIRSGIDIAAFGIGVVGTFSPDSGMWLTEKLITKIFDIDKISKDILNIVSQEAFKTIQSMLMQAGMINFAAFVPPPVGVSTSASSTSSNGLSPVEDPD